MAGSSIQEASVGWDSWRSARGHGRGSTCDDTEAEEGKVSVCQEAGRRGVDTESYVGTLEEQEGGTRVRSAMI